MTKEEFLKQKILFPKDTNLKYCDDPGLGWGGNYSELTILLFGNSLTRLETERINVGIQEFEKLLDELPLLILQAYAFRKRCLAPIKRVQKGMAIPGRLSHIHRLKVRLTAEQRQILYRKPTDQEVDILNDLLNDFKNTHDYCYTINDANGLKRIYKGRRTVLNLAYLIASYRALRKIINDTSFDYKEPYDPFEVMYKPTYPLQVNLNKQIAFVNKMFTLSIKNPRTRESTKAVYMEDLEGNLKKMRMLLNGNPPDLILNRFFRQISSYLWMEERFNAMETSFLLAKTKVIDVCAKCDRNTPRHCPLVFKDSIVKVPCMQKYDILRRVR